MILFVSVIWLLITLFIGSLFLMFSVCVAMDLKCYLEEFKTLGKKQYIEFLFLFISYAIVTGVVFYINGWNIKAFY